MSDKSLDTMSMAELEENLADNIGRFFYNPLGYVQYAFPWGQAGTPLENEDGPDTWQRQVLKQISDKTLGGKHVQIAVASGHGIGKSCLVAWIIMWFMSTRPNAKVVITANTKDQLTSKTWAELAKWHSMAINAHWFTYTATKLYKSGEVKPGVSWANLWFASAIPWSVDRSEAFAGLHGEHTLMLFDEASAIDDVIWEVSEGMMTDALAMKICFGNPTRNDGRFSQCFTDFKHRWQTHQIDSRSAKKADKEKIQEWVDDYGEDHDFVRVRVRGVFPRAGSTQFIPSDLVEAAMKNELDARVWDFAPIVLGVDVARFGDNQTVITARQGKKMFPQQSFRGLDTMEVAEKVVEQIRYRNPILVFIDGVGLGAGVVDRLKQLGYGSLIMDVNAGRPASDKGLYFNKRAEMWGRMKEWFTNGADVPQDLDLKKDLVGLQYGYTQSQQIQLEKKSDMEKRGMASPDMGDSLSLTFAEDYHEISEYDEFYEMSESLAFMTGTGANEITGY